MKKYLSQFYYILMIVVSGFGILALGVAIISSIVGGQEDFLRWSLMSMLPTPVLIISVFFQVIIGTQGIEVAKKIPYLLEGAPKLMVRGVYVAILLFVILTITSYFTTQVYSLVGALLLVNYFSMIVHWSGMKRQ